MSYYFENGIVSTSAGGSTDISGEIAGTGVIYFVDSVNGNDSNAGTNRTEAKATLASALSSVTDNNGDIVIIEASHTETLSSALTISQVGVRILGLGSGSTKPSFTVNAAVDGFDITGANNEIHNLLFPVGTTTPNTSRINVTTVNNRIVDCDFYCGANDPNSITVPAGGDYLEVNGCTFTISADGPDRGINIEAAGVDGIKIIGCTFDGGDYDFDNAGISSAAAHTNFLYRDNVLTNKASIIHTAAATGQCVGTVAGDGSRVDI